MNRHVEIHQLPDAREHHSLAGYLAHYSACSPAEAETVLASARIGAGIVLPALAAWASGSETSQREAAAHREHLRTLYGDRLDTSAVEAAPVARGVSTTSASDGWAEAFGKTNARRADDPDPFADAAPAASMRQAMDEAIARLKGEDSYGGI